MLLCRGHSASPRVRVCVCVARSDIADGAHLCGGASLLARPCACMGARVCEGAARSADAGSSLRRRAFACPDGSARAPPHNRCWFTWNSHVVVSFVVLALPYACAAGHLCLVCMFAGNHARDVYSSRAHALYGEGSPHSRITFIVANHKTGGGGVRVSVWAHLM